MARNTVCVRIACSAAQQRAALPYSESSNPTTISFRSSLSTPAPSSPNRAPTFNPSMFSVENRVCGRQSPKHETSGTFVTKRIRSAPTACRTPELRESHADGRGRRDFAAT